MSGPGAVDGRGFSVPTVGEIVIVPGRWPGEEAVGIVQGVRTRIDKTSSVVDVVELRSVGGSMYANPQKLQHKVRTEGSAFQPTPFPPSWLPCEPGERRGRRDSALIAPTLTHPFSAR